MKQFEFLGVAFAAVGFGCISIGFLLIGFYLGVLSNICLIYFIVKQPQNFYGLLGLQIFFLFANILGIYNNI